MIASRTYRLSLLFMLITAVFVGMVASFNAAFAACAQCADSLVNCPTCSLRGAIFLKPGVDQKFKETADSGQSAGFDFPTIQGPFEVLDDNNDVAGWRINVVWGQDSDKQTEPFFVCFFMEYDQDTEGPKDGRCNSVAYQPSEVDNQGSSTDNGHHVIGAKAYAPVSGDVYVEGVNGYRVIQGNTHTVTGLNINGTGDHYVAKVVDEQGQVVMSLYDADSTTIDASDHTVVWKTRGGYIESTKDSGASSVRTFDASADPDNLSASTPESVSATRETTIGSYTKRRVTTETVTQHGTRYETTIYIIDSASDKVVAVAYPKDVARLVLSSGSINGPQVGNPGAECDLDNSAKVPVSMFYNTGSPATIGTYGSVIYNYSGTDIVGTVTRCGSCGEAGEGTTYAYGTVNASPSDSWTDIHTYKYTTLPSGERIAEFYNERKLLLYRAVLMVEPNGSAPYTTAGDWAITAYRYWREEDTGATLEFETTNQLLHGKVARMYDTQASSSATFAVTLDANGEWPTDVTVSAGAGNTGIVREFTYDGNSGRVTKEEISKGVDSGQTRILVREYTYSKVAGQYRVTEMKSYPSPLLTGTNFSKASTITEYDYDVDSVTTEELGTIDVLRRKTTKIHGFAKNTESTVPTEWNGPGGSITVRDELYHWDEVDEDADSNVDRIENHRLVLVSTPNGQSDITVTYHEWDHPDTADALPKQIIKTTRDANIPAGPSSGDLAAINSAAATAYGDFVTSGTRLALATEYELDNDGDLIRVVSPDKTASESVTLILNHTAGTPTTAITTHTVSHSTGDMYDTNGDGTGIWHYDKTPISVTISDVGETTLHSLAVMPDTATDGNLANDYDKDYSPTAMDDSGLLNQLDIDASTSGIVSRTSYIHNADATAGTRTVTTRRYKDASNYLEEITVYNLDSGRMIYSQDSTGLTSYPEYDYVGRVTETRQTSSQSGYDDEDDTTYWVVSASTYAETAPFRMTEQKQYLNASDSITTNYYYEWDGSIDYTQTSNGHRSTTTLSLHNEGSTSEHGVKSTTLHEFNHPNDGWIEVSEQVSFADGRGQVWKTETKRYYHNGSNWVTQSQAVVSLSWYAPSGRTVKTKSATGIISKTVVDTAGRVKERYTLTDESTGTGGEQEYASAFTTTNDEVISQSKMYYDAKGRQFFSTSFERKTWDSTESASIGNGALDKSEAYFQASTVEFDEIGRTVATYNFGRDESNFATTAVGNPYSSGTTLQLDLSSISSGDKGTKVIVTDMTYDYHDFNSDGWLESYSLTTLNDGSIIAYRSDNLGRTLRTVEDAKRDVSSTDDTDYLNDLPGSLDITYQTQHRITDFTYDDDPAGSGAEAGYGMDQTAYNVDSNGSTFYNEAQVTKTRSVRTTASGSTHGQVTTTTTYPGDSNSAITVVLPHGQLSKMTDQRGVTHTYTYDTLGRRTKDEITSTPLPAGITDEVKSISFTYDDFNRIEKITSRNSSNTIVNEITYSYGQAEANVGQITNSAQNIHGTTRNVGYNYELFSIDSSPTGLSRFKSTTYPNSDVVSISYATGDAPEELNLPTEVAHGTSKVAQYTYAGAGRIARLEYTDGSTVIAALNYENDSTPGVDNGSFNALDNFGRLTEVKWRDSLGTTYNVLDHFTYGYDSMGNRTFRDNQHGSASGLDELYSHDALDRMTGVERGTLSSGSITSLMLDQSWAYDTLGNWNAFDETDNQPTTPTTLNQTRTHNAANEITDIAEDTGQAAWSTPAYDAAGNMTAGPQPLNPTSSYTFIYDGWSRLVQVKDGANVVATYEYDGLNRRVRKTLGDPSSPTSTTDYIYNTNWQILEAYEGSTLVEQNVWGLDYVDSPALMKLYDSATSSLVDRRALFDANRHVTALLGDGSNAATVVERYAYDPYGQVLFMDASFNIDTTQTASEFGNEVLFTGMRYNPETGTYHVRRREWYPPLGRWMQEDPAGDVDGANLYAGYFVMAGAVDPSGLKIIEVKNCNWHQEFFLRERDKAVQQRLDYLVPEFTKMDYDWVDKNYGQENYRTVKKVGNKSIFDNYHRTGKMYLKRMQTQITNGIKVECACKCEGGTYAKVPFYFYIFKGDYIVFCPLYFKEKKDDQEDIFFHELTHLTYSSDHNTDWQSPKYQLARAPDSAYFMQRFMSSDIKRHQAGNIWQYIWEK